VSLRDGPDRRALRGLTPAERTYSRGMKQLVMVQLDFKTEADAGQMAERVREAVRMVVGGEALEDFRWRVMPLDSGPSR
jgi:hypothetical protein